MRQALLRAWNSFWFRPAGPTGLLAARSIVCAQALWILLSRPNLPEILDWPHAFWLGVDRALAGRFLILGLPTGIERALYWLLLAGLAAGVLGFFSRASGLAVALLLYHFAAFEDIFSSRGGPFFRGLTVPVVALVLLACAEMPRWRARASPELRWPLAATQVLFAFTYFFSGISKLLAMGPRWFSARNFQGLVLGLIFPEVSPPWSRAVAASTALCQAGAVAAFALDFLLVLAAFSPRAARFAIPALAVGHLLVVKILGVVFLGLPLLLIFVDWDAIAGQIERRRSAGGLRKAEGILSAPQAGPEPPRSLHR